MSAAVLVESTPVVSSAAPVAAAPIPSEALIGHDVARERELDLMAANVESAAEGLAVFLLLALFGVAFLVATLTGVLA